MFLNKFKTVAFLLVSLLLSVNISAQNGKIKGKIIDKINHEPLPFANIIIKGTQIGVISDMEGMFELTGLKPGFVNLEASFVGYKSKTSEDILVSNNNIPFVELEMESIDNVLNEVYIVVDPFNKKEEAPLSMQTIGVREIESNPGSNRDISRVIQSFPGVGSTPFFRNDIIIRGGGPSENRFFLDDVEIPFLNHFSTQGSSGGPVGIINADFIKSVDYYSGSFPADKYNALSGVFDFRQKDGSMDRTNVQFAVGASEASFTLDGPLGSSTNYIFSVRRSYLQYLFQAIGLPFLPTFNDYQLKVKKEFNKNNQLTLISIGSLDHFAINEGIKNPTKTQEYILAQIPVNNQWTYTVGAVYKKFFKNGYHSVVLSRNMLNNTFYKHPDNDETKQRVFDYYSTEEENKLRYELDFKKNKIKYIFSAGVEYAQHFNDTKIQIFLNDQINNFQNTTELDLFKYGISGQASTRFFNQKLLASLGIRMDGSSFNKNMKNPFNQISPRLSLSYTLSPKSSINAGTGRYYQLPAYTTLAYKNFFGELANLESKYIGVDHYSLGVQHRLSKGIVVSVEGFIKRYFNYPIDKKTGLSVANQGADYDIAGATTVFSGGKGQAKGLEVLARFNFKSFSSIASYTYVRSLFDNLEGKELPSSWDSQHLLTITGSKEFKKNWRVGFKWRFVGGLPYTPYDLEKSENIKAWKVLGKPYYDYSRANSERLKSFHQLDLRIDKNFFFKSWSLMVYLDVQNVYKFQNEGQDYVVRKKDENGEYLTKNNGEDYILERVENVSGVLLPSIGIMVKW